ncbi:MAG: TerC/Alx family metal homeostasis membrane protein [Actinomycetaceae bacterium]|nr:TerC/Alx family metal homeostasis membrane protein [Actinomycetaceae bacterium]
MHSFYFAQTSSFHIPQSHWFFLIIGVVGILIFDLVTHVYKPHEPTVKESSLWLIFYVILASLFGVYSAYFYSGDFAVEYFAVFLTEYALSVDNIFIFIVIMASFRLQRKYQQKALLYGIVIALVLRLVFILLGATILEKFSFMFFIFAAYLIYTAISELREGIAQPDEGDPENYEPNLVIRLASKFLPVTQGFVGDKIIVRRAKKTYVTPFFLCILSIGTADLMFALDSIPASFGLSKHAFIIFSANAFALMGLRQMFFLVDALLSRLAFLHYGLAVILGFIGVKLCLEACHGMGWLVNVPMMSPMMSIVVVLSVLVVTVVSSLVYAGRKNEDQES